MNFKAISKSWDVLVFFNSGYAVSQGLSEDLIGGLLAAAASSGIVGTLIYPRARKRLGLRRTGLVALGAELSSLTLCVISVFMPGSPFDPLYFTRETAEDTATALTGNNAYIPSIPSFKNNTLPVYTENVMDDVTSTVTWNQTSLHVFEDTKTHSQVSIALLMAGIIGARIGNVNLLFSHIS